MEFLKVYKDFFSNLITTLIRHPDIYRDDTFPKGKALLGFPRGKLLSVSETDEGEEKVEPFVVRLIQSRSW